MIKNIIKKVLNKIKYHSINNYIIDNNIDMIDKCYKKEYGNFTSYINIIGVNKSNNTCKALVVDTQNKSADNNEEESVVLSTDKFGPYTLDSSTYENESMSIHTSINIDIDFIKNEYTEISKDEFIPVLTSTMDSILGIVY